MADEDQRDAREADVVGGDRRDAERERSSNDSRHEQMDGCIGSEGIRFLEASWRANAASLGIAQAGACRDSEGGRVPGRRSEFGNGGSNLVYRCPDRAE